MDYPIRWQITCLSVRARLTRKSEVRRMQRRTRYVFSWPLVRPGIWDEYRCRGLPSRSTRCDCLSRLDRYYLLDYCSYRSLFEATSKHVGSMDFQLGRPRRVQIISASLTRVSSYRDAAGSSLERESNFTADKGRVILRKEGVRERGNVGIRFWGECGEFPCNGELYVLCTVEREFNCYFCATIFYVSNIHEYVCLIVTCWCHWIKYLRGF